MVGRRQIRDTRSGFHAKDQRRRKRLVRLLRSGWRFPHLSSLAETTPSATYQGEFFWPDVSAAVSSDPADTKFLHCAEVDSWGPRTPVRFYDYLRLIQRRT